MKFCKDCKWFVRLERSGYCTHKEGEIFVGDDLVWGPQDVSNPEAWSMRDANQSCGPDALLFEEKVK